VRPRRVHNDECPGSAVGELVSCSGSRTPPGVSAPAARHVHLPRTLRPDL